MRILIDESLPRQLKHILSGYETETVQEAGWAGVKNGALLNLAEGHYRVFLTADKNLQYQQNLARRSLAVIVFPSNKLSVVRKLAGELRAALDEIQGGVVIELDISGT